MHVSLLLLLLNRSIITLHSVREQRNDNITGTLFVLYCFLPSPLETLSFFLENSGNILFFFFSVYLAQAAVFYPIGE